MRVGGSTTRSRPTRPAARCRRPGAATSRTGTSSATCSPTCRPGPSRAASGRRPRCVRGPTTVLYYTVREAFTGRQCLSRRGQRLAGRTVPRRRRPRRSSAASTGAIDPSPFVDANGNAVPAVQDRATGADLEPPAHAGRPRFAGPPREILAPSQRWEGGNVEAPSMLRNGSAYWLFYSGNDWNGRDYAEGIGPLLGPVGPVHAPTARTRCSRRVGGIAGPGGGEVFSDGDGSWRLAYHAYQRAARAATRTAGCSTSPASASTATARPTLEPRSTATRRERDPLAPARPPARLRLHPVEPGGEVQARVDPEPPQRLRLPRRRAVPDPRRAR